MKNTPRGLWATMLTPFRNDGLIDYRALEYLIEWYLEQGVDGLFAVCFSSESFHLDRGERLDLARFVVQRARGRVPVIAGATFPGSADEAAAEIRDMARTGVDAAVILASVIVPEDVGETGFLDSMHRLLDELPEDLPLGLYESTRPYHRILSLAELSGCAETGRFGFFKDTSCDIDIIRDRLRVLLPKGMPLFNANTQSLGESVAAGAAGYSSVMANVTPRLHKWILLNGATAEERAAALQGFLSVADAAVVSRSYPASAKYFLAREGLPMGTYTRSLGGVLEDKMTMATMDGLRPLVHAYEKEYEEQHEVAT